MTRKHYIAIAAALAATRPAYPDYSVASSVEHDRLNQWIATVGALVDILADDNPRFDRALFWKAAINA